MATTVAELVARLGLDNSNFVSGVDSSLKKFESFGSKMTSLGKDLSLKVTAPLMAIGAAALYAFSQQESAEMKLRAALMANGREVDSLFASYSEFATEMQKVTIVGDETTLKLLQLAETYGITGKSAERAAKNAIAMQAAFGINAESAIKLTSALEQGDTAMLTRYIPSLKSVEGESAKVALAQEILAKSFDVAKAEAQTASGQITQLKNSFGDLLEQFGKIISEAILPFVANLKVVVERLQGMSEAKKRLIVVIAAFAAAIGPVLVGLGFFATTILPAMITGFTILTGPIGLVIAAIAALAAAFIYVRANWEAIKERITDIGWWTNTLIDMAQFVLKYNPIALLIKPYEYLLGLLGIEIPNPFEKVSDALEGMRKETKQYTHEFGSFKDAVKNAAKAALSSFGQIKEEAKEGEEEIEGMENAVNGLGAAIKKLSHSPLTAKGMLGFTFTELGKEIEDFKARQKFEGLFDGIKMALVEVKTPLTDALRELGDNVDNIITNNIGNALSGLAETLGGALASGQNVVKALGMSLLQSMQQFLSQLGDQLIAFAVAAGAFAKLQLALANPITGVVAAGTALAAGLALKALSGAIGGFAARGGNTPRFAKGGMVTGLTTAVLGDNPSGKEAVIPFERMGEFLGKYGGGQMQMQAYTFASGEDLQIVLSNYNARTGRNLG
jgi:hypothetical protein